MSSLLNWSKKCSPSTYKPCHCYGEDTLADHLLYKMELSFGKPWCTQCKRYSDNVPGWSFASFFCWCSFIVFNWLFISNEITTYSLTHLLPLVQQEGGKKQWDGSQTRETNIFSTAIYKQRNQSLSKVNNLIFMLHLCFRGMKAR